MVRPQKDGLRRRPGRPASVSPAAVAAVGLELFLRDGFDKTTMTGIAEAAEIGRKTLFEYFPNKADIIWNRFEPQLDDLINALDHAPAGMASTDAVSQAVLRGLHMGPLDAPTMRAEVTMIGNTPSLQAYAFMRGEPWRAAIAQFLAGREGQLETDVLPQVLGHGYWQAMFVGFRQWLETTDPSPVEYVTAAVEEFAAAVRGAFRR